MTFQLAEKVSIAAYTTFHVGGVADYVITVTDIEGLRDALSWARQQVSLPLLVLGGGSNVVMSDEGYRGVVIINRIHGYAYTHDAGGEVVTIGAGEVLDDAIARLAADGYWGLENLSAIPGTVGATPIQNVGAYGVEVSDVVVSVSAVHKDSGEQRVFARDECGFGYRDSFFKKPEGRAWIITEVTFRVTKTYAPVLTYKDLAPLVSETLVTPEQVRAAVIAIRSKKFPDWRTVGTAGSFFKNPLIGADMYHALQVRYPDIPGYLQADGQVKVSLGWILDHVCSLKGYREGLVRLYEAQALVMVAERGATAAEIATFASRVEAIVFEKTGIVIEREVQFVM